MFYPFNEERNIAMKRHLLVILFLMSAIGAQAQNAHLRIVSLINFPDTAYEGVSYPVQFVLKNVGPAAFQGPFQVILQADSGTEIFYFNQSPNFILLPNDTMILSPGNGALGYYFSSSVYKTGNDVVVVWPYSTQMSVGIDTLYTAVYFIPTGTVSNGQELIKSGLSIFPNPFNDVIYLKPADGTMVESVRITDLFGREIYRNENATDLINLPEMQSGLYILELETADNRKVVLKILKQ